MMVFRNLSLWLVAVLAAGSACAHTGLPSLFSSNMVLQQKQKNKVWGWGDAGGEISVIISNQVHKTVVDDEGTWQVTLDPMEAGGPHRMEVVGHDRIVFDNVMVGEVWICSGQ
ncbi:MAG: sialate O-acetylesterase, partial [Verrucomicrobiota bacterium]